MTTERYINTEERVGRTAIPDGAESSFAEPGSRAEPPDTIDTRFFANKGVLRTEYPPGAMCRVQYVDVRAGDLPAGVRERLRQHGCGPWVDEADELIPLGEAVCLNLFGRGTFGPRPEVPLSDIVARVRSGPTPAERREREREQREWEAHHRAKTLARRQAEDERRLAAARERSGREAEAERRRQHLIAEFSLRGTIPAPPSVPLPERRGTDAAVRRPRPVSGVGPVVDDVIDTRPFESRCSVMATIWPKGSPHRVRLLSVRAGDVPAEVRDRLRDAGCGPLDDPETMIPLGEEMALGRPRTTVAVAEVVRLVQAEAARRARPAEAGGIP
jgi:hypothetical protein